MKSGETGSRSSSRGSSAGRPPGARFAASPASEMALVLLAGAALFAAAAAIERLLGTSPAVSAVLEESLKTISILSIGYFAYRASMRRPDAPGTGRERRARLAAARGISLGLASTLAFAGIENLAYLFAFPEAGILARLAWSLPVHLVAALLEALGALASLTALAAFAAGRRSRLRALASGGALVALVAAGSAWHAAANVLVDSGIASWTYVGGATASLALAQVLVRVVTRRAYNGGFLHGTE